MKTFIGRDFLLHNDTAKELYYNHAEHLPIIDYHCHLNPREVADDRRFRSITELWLGGDHYKWRAMRANGVDERYITGDADDWEKFEKWADTVAHAFRNPLYHWTHMELRTAFGIDTVLNPDTARSIYEECNARLREPGFSARGLMLRYNVEAVCTTDDPADTLEYHARIRRSGFKVKVLPAWRPDKALDVCHPASYKAYMHRLSEAADTDITTYDDLLSALRKRHAFFHSQGCRLSDHGIDRFYDEGYTAAEVRCIFASVMQGSAPSPADAAKFRSALLHELAVMDAEAGWVQQFHYGPIRNNNSRMFARIGADGGFDSIGEFATALPMAHFFDRLDSAGKLAKTIIYNLNPAANDMVATMIGNFQDGSVPGKMQWGAAWWFSDQKNGIEKHLDTLSLQGLLSRFVGMLTDSRSFLSYPRHDYFRRILCNLIGRDVERGELPVEEMPRISRMVEDICYYNAKNYFGF